MNFPHIINQYKFAFYTTVSLCIICAFPFLNAQETIKMEEVIIEGVGTSPEAAKRNAFRNAVSKVVGSFIENDILIKNDKIIEDKLLEYSGGFVETFEIISESKDKDGLFKVKLKAKIAQQTVVEKLRSMKIDVKSVSGSNLKAQLDTQETMKKEGGKLINSIMEEYPKLWQAKQIGEPKIANRKLALQIEVSVDRDKYLAWAEKLCKVLGKSADSKDSRTFTKDGHANYDKPLKILGNEELHFVVDSPFHHDASKVFLSISTKTDSGIILSVVEDFYASGKCKVAYFLFEDSNPLYPFFKALEKNDIDPSTVYLGKFAPNQFNLMIYDSSERVIYKYNFKLKWPDSPVLRGVNFGWPLHYDSRNGLPALSPFPYAERLGGISRDYANYSSKLIINANLPTEDFDVAKISKITTGFSIEK